MAPHRLLLKVVPSSCSLKENVPSRFTVGIRLIAGKKDRVKFS